MTFSKSCILSDPCKQVDSHTCNRVCPSYISMHGSSGQGGRHGSANIPKDYAFVTALNSPVRDSQAEVYKSIDAYVKTFIRQFEASGERIKSLYLFSQNSGTGKTTSAVACLNSYLITYYIGSLQRGTKPMDRPVFFLDVNEWQTLYNAFNRNKVPDEIAEPASDKYYRWMELAKETPFVVLDDLAVRSVSEPFRADLHSVISHRVSNQKPSVYTSNVPLSELPTIFGEQRLYDRIRDLCIQLNFVGESKRGKR